MPLIRPLTRSLVRPLTHAGTADRALAIFYKFLAGLNAKNPAPLVAAKGISPTQVGTSAVVIPDRTGTLVMIAGATPGNPAIPWANYSGGVFSDTSVSATKTVLQSGLTRYSGGPAGNPSLGVLCGPSVSNVCTQSQTFTTTWTATNASPLADQTAAPDGTTTADLLVDNAATGTGNVYLTSGGLTGTANTVHTLSVFAKKNGLNWIRLGSASFTNNPYAFFDLQNGAVGTTSGSPTTAIKAYANGWYRCSIAWDVGADNTGAARIYVANADNDLTCDLDGTSSVYLWGAQLEALPVATSYIATTTTSVTRAARYLTMTGSDIGSKLRFNLVSNETLSTAGRTTRLFSDGTRMLTYENGTGTPGLLVFRDESQVMGSELWPYNLTTGTGLTVTGNDATHIVTFGAGGMRYQSDTTTPLLNVATGNILTRGKTYRVVFNGITASGTLKADLGSAGSPAITLGTPIVFTAYNQTISIYRNSTNVDVTISSISLYEVAELTSAQTLTVGTAYQIGVDMGTSAALYVNGSSVATATFPAAAQFSGTTYIGSSTTGTNVLNGQITCIESSSDPLFSAGGTT